MQTWWSGLCLAAGLLLLPMVQAKAEIRIARHPSTIHVPTYIMAADHLIEARAAAPGVPDLKVDWVNLNGRRNAADALLAGSIDVVNTGVGDMLLLWDRTRGGVNGIVATPAEPLGLMTAIRPIKTLRDYTPQDKIAAPTVRIPTQAILLQIACEEVFGAGQGAKLDTNTVQLGHPDAAGAMPDPHGETTSHFSAAPVVFKELRRGPGVSSDQGGLCWFSLDNRNLLDIPALFAGLLTVIVIDLAVENRVFPHRRAANCRWLGRAELTNASK